MRSGCFFQRSYSLHSKDRSTEGAESRSAIGSLGMDRDTAIRAGSAHKDKVLNLAAEDLRGVINLQIKLIEEQVLADELAKMLKSNRSLHPKDLQNGSWRDEMDDLIAKYTKRREKTKTKEKSDVKVQ